MCGARHRCFTLPSSRSRKMRPMRYVLKIVVTMLAMLMLSGVLFPGPAYAADAMVAAAAVPAPVAMTAPAALTSPDTAKAAAPKPAEKPAGPPPQAPVIGAEIATTDQCFGKYPEEKDPCGLKACLLTLEREAREVVQEFFVQCKAQPAQPIAAVAPPVDGK